MKAMLVRWGHGHRTMKESWILPVIAILGIGILVFS